MAVVEGDAIDLVRTLSVDRLDADTDAAGLVDPDAVAVVAGIDVGERQSTDVVAVDPDAVRIRRAYCDAMAIVTADDVALDEIFTTDIVMGSNEVDTVAVVADVEETDRVFGHADQVAEDAEALAVGIGHQDAAGQKTHRRGPATESVGWDRIGHSVLTSVEADDVSRADDDRQAQRVIDRVTCAGAGRPRGNHPHTGFAIAQCRVEKGALQAGANEVAENEIGKDDPPRIDQHASAVRVPVAHEVIVAGDDVVNADDVCIGIVADRDAVAGAAAVRYGKQRCGIGSNAIVEDDVAGGILTEDVDAAVVIAGDHVTDDAVRRDAGQGGGQEGHGCRQIGELARQWQGTQRRNPTIGEAGRDRDTVTTIGRSGDAVGQHAEIGIIDHETVPNQIDGVEAAVVNDQADEA